MANGTQKIRSGSALIEDRQEPAKMDFSEFTMDDVVQFYYNPYADNGTAVKMREVVQEAGYDVQQFRRKFNEQIRPFYKRNGGTIPINNPYTWERDLEIDALTENAIRRNNTTLMGDMGRTFYNSAFINTAAGIKWADNMIGLASDSYQGKDASPEQILAMESMLTWMDKYKADVVRDMGHFTDPGLSINDRMSKMALATAQGFGSLVPVIGGSLVGKLVGAAPALVPGGQKLAVVTSKFGGRAGGALGATLNMMPFMYEAARDQGLSPEEAAGFAVPTSLAVGISEMVGLSYISSFAGKALAKQTIKEYAKSQGFKTSIKKFSESSAINLKAKAIAANLTAQQKLRIAAQTAPRAFLSGFGVEFIQEGAQYYIEDLGKMIHNYHYKNDGTRAEGDGLFIDHSWQKDLRYSLEEAFVGGIVGGFFGAGVSSGSMVLGKNTRRRLGLQPEIAVDAIAPMFIDALQSGKTKRVQSFFDAVNKAIAQEHISKEEGQIALDKLSEIQRLSSKVWKGMKNKGAMQQVLELYRAVEGTDKAIELLNEKYGVTGGTGIEGDVLEQKLKPLRDLKSRVESLINEISQSDNTTNISKENSDIIGLSEIAQDAASEVTNINTIANIQKAVNYGIAETVNKIQKVYSRKILKAKDQDAKQKLQDEMVARIEEETGISIDQLRANNLTPAFEESTQQGRQRGWRGKSQEENDNKIAENESLLKNNPKEAQDRGINNDSKRISELSLDELIAEIHDGRGTAEHMSQARERLLGENYGGKRIATEEDVDDIIYGRDYKSNERADNVETSKVAKRVKEKVKDADLTEDGQEALDEVNQGDDVRLTKSDFNNENYGVEPSEDGKYNRDDVEKLARKKEQYLSEQRTKREQELSKQKEADKIEKAEILKGKPTEDAEVKVDKPKKKTKKRKTTTKQKQDKKEQLNIFDQQETDESLRQEIEDLFKEDESNKTNFSAGGLSPLLTSDFAFKQFLFERMEALFPELSITQVKDIFNEHGVEMLGKIVGNSILISDSATQDTILHEAAHPYVDFLRAIDDKLASQALSLFKNTPLYNRVKNMKGNQFLSEEDLAIEVLVTAMSMDSLKKLKAEFEGVSLSRFEKIKQFIKSAWVRTRALFGKAQFNEIVDVLSSDFLKAKRYKKRVNGKTQYYSGAEITLTQQVNRTLMSTLATLVVNGKSIDINNPAQKNALFKAIENLLTKNLSEQVKGENVVTEETRGRVKEVYRKFLGTILPEQDVNDIMRISDENNYSVGYMLVRAYQSNIETMLNNMTISQTQISTVLDVQSEGENVQRKDVLSEKAILPESVSTLLKFLIDEDGNLINDEFARSIISSVAERSSNLEEFKKNLRMASKFDVASGPASSAFMNMIDGMRREDGLPLLNEIYSQSPKNFVSLVYAGNELILKNMTEARESAAKEIAANINKKVKGSPNTFSDAYRRYKTITIELPTFYDVNTKEGDVGLDAAVELLNKAGVEVTRSQLENSPELSQKNFQSIYFFIEDLAKINEVKGYDIYRAQSARLQALTSATQDVFKHLTSFVGQKNNNKPGVDSTSWAQVIGRQWGKLSKTVYNGDIFKDNPYVKRLNDIYNKNGSVTQKDYIAFLDAITGDLASKEHFEMESNEKLFTELAIFSRGANEYLQSVGVLADRDVNVFFKTKKITNINTVGKLISEIKRLRAAEISRIKKKYKGDKKAVANVDNYLNPDETKIRRELNNIVSLLRALRKQNQIRTNKILGNLTEEQFALSFYANDLINHFHATRFLIGDHAQFGTVENLEKRVAGVLSPNTQLQSEEDLRIVYLKEESFPVEFFGDILDNTGDSFAMNNLSFQRMVKNQGGKIKKYGLNNKPVAFQLDSEGDLFFWKTSTETITTDLRNTSKAYAFFGQLMDAFESKLGSETKIVFAFESAMKGSKKYLDSGAYLDWKDTYNKSFESETDIDGVQGYKKYQFNQDMLNSLAASITEDVIPFSNIGMQGTVSKNPNVGDIALSNQKMMYTMNYSSDLSQKNKIEKLLTDLLSIQLDKSKASFSSTENIVRTFGNQPLGGAGVYGQNIALSALDNNSLLNHPNVSNLLQAQLSRMLGNAGTKPRVSGAQLHMIPDIGSEENLKFYKDGETVFAEVKVPEGFANVGDILIHVRIPASGPYSDFVAKVVGYTGKAEDGRNTILTPAAYIKASNADFDKDMLFTFKKFDGDKLTPEQKIINDIHEQFTDVMLSDNYRDATKVELDVVDIQNKAPLQSTSVFDRIDIFNKIKSSSANIGQFATLSKMYDFLQANQNFNGLGLEGVADKVTYTTTDGRRMSFKSFGNTIQEYNKRKLALASILQTALDDGKHFNMGYTGINRDNANLAGLMLMFGVDLNETMSFFKQAHVQSFFEGVANMNDSFSRNKRFTKNSLTARLSEEISELLDTAKKTGEKFTKEINDLRFLRNLAQMSNQMRPVRAAMSLMTSNFGNNIFDVLANNELMTKKYEVKENERLYFDAQVYLENPIIKHIVSVSNEIISANDKISFFENSNFVKKIRKEVEINYNLEEATLNDSRVVAAVKEARRLANNSQLKYEYQTIEDVNGVLKMIDFMKSQPRTYADAMPFLSRIQLSYDTDGVPIRMAHNRNFDSANEQQMNEIRDAFKSLPKVVQDIIYDYSYINSGLLGHSFNIVELLPESYYTNSLNNLQNIEQDELIESAVVSSFAQNNINEFNFYNVTKSNVFRATPQDIQFQIDATNESVNIKGLKLEFLLSNKIDDQIIPELVVYQDQLYEKMSGDEMTYRLSSDLLLSNVYQGSKRNIVPGQIDTKPLPNVPFTRIPSLTESRFFRYNTDTQEHSVIENDNVLELSRDDVDFINNLFDGQFPDYFVEVQPDNNVGNQNNIVRESATGIELFRYQSEADVEVDEILTNMKMQAKFANGVESFKDQSKYIFSQIVDGVRSPGFNVFGTEQEAQPKAEVPFSYIMFSETSDAKLSWKTANIMLEKGGFNVMLNKLSELYPSVIVAKSKPEFLKKWDGSNDEKYGVAFKEGMRRVVWWANNNAKIENAPHEYAHHYIDMFRADPLIQQAIQRYGEEELVDRMGKAHYKRYTRSAFAKIVRDIWFRIQQFFGAADIALVIENYFNKGVAPTSRLLPPATVNTRNTEVVGYKRKSYYGDVNYLNDNQLMDESYIMEGLLELDDIGVAPKIMFNEGGFQTSINDISEIAAEEKIYEKLFPLFSLGSEQQAMQLYFNGSSRAQIKKSFGVEVSDNYEGLFEKYERLLDRRLDGKSRGSRKKIALVDDVKLESIKEKLNLDPSYSTELKEALLFGRGSETVQADATLIRRVQQYIMTQQRNRNLLILNNGSQNNQNDFMDLNDVISILNQQLNNGKKSTVGNILRRFSVSSDLLWKGLKSDIQAFSLTGARNNVLSLFLNKSFQQAQKQEQTISNDLVDTFNSVLRSRLENESDKAYTKRMADLDRYLGINVTTNTGRKVMDILNSKAKVTLPTMDGSVDMTLSEAIHLKLIDEQQDVSIVGQKFIFADTQNGERGTREYTVDARLVAELTALFRRSNNNRLLRAFRQTFAKTYNYVNPVYKSLYGIDLESVDGYVPTPRGEILKDPTQKFQADMAPDIDEKSFLLPRVDDATKPLRITDIFSLTNRYQREVSEFSSYAIPYRNAKNLLGKLFSRENVNLAFSKDNYTKTEITNVRDAFDLQADRFIRRKMLEQGNLRESERFFDGLLNNFTLAVLGANPFVAAKQLASLPLATNVIEARYFSDTRLLYGATFAKLVAKGLSNVTGKVPTDDAVIQRAVKHSTVFRQRFTQGKVDVDLQRALGLSPTIGPSRVSRGKRRRAFYKKFFRIDLNEQGNENLSALSARLGDKQTYMGYILAMDAATVGTIWRAAERKVSAERPELEFDSKEYGALVASIAEEALQRTQPVYDKASTPTLFELRRQRVFIRALTMFFTQRSQNYNLLTEAYIDLKYNKPGARARASRLFATVAFLSSLVVSGIDVLRDFLFGRLEDEDESALLRLFKKFQAAALGNFPVIGGLISDAINRFTGSSQYRGAVQNPIVQGIDGLIYGTTAITKGEFEDGVLRTAKAAAQFTGTPVVTPISILQEILEEEEPVRVPLKRGSGRRGAGRKGPKR